MCVFGLTWGLCGDQEKELGQAAEEVEQLEAQCRQLEADKVPESSS